MNILLTLGKRGCVYYGADGSEIRGKAITVEAVDTTAAGDTHFGFFLRAESPKSPYRNTEAGEQLQW